MITTLAQAKTTTVLDTVTHVFSRADTLAHPESLMTHLQTLSVVWSVIFLVVGVLCLFNGYKFYRIATIGLALAIGATAGYALGTHIKAPYVVAGCLALLLAVACFPMMKYAVAVLGGLSGAWIGANVWTSVCHLLMKTNPDAVVTASSNHWIGALIGLIVFGMLAFILFKLSIVLLTSVSGSTIAVLGMLALLLQFKPWQETIRTALSGHALIIPMLVLVAATIGLILQETSAAQSSSVKEAS